MLEELLLHLPPRLADCWFHRRVREAERNAPMGKRLKMVCSAGDVHTLIESRNQQSAGDPGRSRHGRLHSISARWLNTRGELKRTSRSFAGTGNAIWQHSGDGNHANQHG
jgi:hypothetical protein